jgi:hypothetical protein
MQKKFSLLFIMHLVCIGFNENLIFTLLATEIDETLIYQRMKLHGLHQRHQKLMVQIRNVDHQLYASSNPNRGRQETQRLIVLKFSLAKKISKTRNSIEKVHAQSIGSRLINVAQHLGFMSIYVGLTYVFSSSMANSASAHAMGASIVSHTALTATAVFLHLKTMQPKNVSAESV